MDAEAYQFYIIGYVPAGGPGEFESIPQTCTAVKIDGRIYSGAGPNLYSAPEAWAQPWQIIGHRWIRDHWDELADGTEIHVMPHGNPFDTRLDTWKVTTVRNTKLLRPPVGVSPRPLRLRR